jgi:hypothetical protein
LTIAGGTALAASSSTIAGTPAAAADASGLPLLQPLPPDQPDRSLFAPDEQRYAGYAAILAPMANDIRDDGFWTGGWWGSPNTWWNPRKGWHIYTLSWFYANERPWNPYFGDPALLARIDVAIRYYLNLQFEDGSFPEGSATGHGRAATGFFMGYLAKTLAILRQAGILPQRQQDIRASLRAAMNWFLDPDSLRGEPGNKIPVWDVYVRGANQAAAGLAGATLALELDPDSALEAKLLDRVEYLAEHGQSPSGYFYEELGWDYGYNVNVMLPEMAEIYLRTSNPTLVAMTEKYVDWLGYNMLREPDGSGWLTYIATSARTNTASVDDVETDPYRAILGSHLVPEVPALGAFFTSNEDMVAARDAWAAESGPAPALIKPDTSPRIIAHAPYGEALPSDRAKAAAIRQLPYLRDKEFVELRRDPGQDQDYLYVRRPSLYVGAHFGTRDTTNVRTGPGFLWHPDAGTIVHSQKTNDACWGTVLAGGSSDADGDLPARYMIGGRGWQGTHASPGRKVVQVDYSTRDGVPAEASVNTRLVINPANVIRIVRAASEAVEQIPLVLHPDDTLLFDGRTPAPYGQTTTGNAARIVLRRGGTTIEISWGDTLPATLASTTTTFLRDERRRLHVLRIEHPGTITTTITCTRSRS